MNLYEITQNMMALDALIDEYAEEHIGDISDISDTIDKWGAEIPLDEKLESIAKLLRNWSASVDALQMEEKRLAYNRRAIEQRIDRLKEWTIYCMEASGMKKRESGIFSFSLREAAMRPLVLKIDAKYLPARFLKVKTEADNMAIRKAIESGEDMSGVAELGQKTKFLVIK